jgi:hypothetical protein
MRTYLVELKCKACNRQDSTGVKRKALKTYSVGCVKCHRTVKVLFPQWSQVSMYQANLEVTISPI